MFAVLLPALPALLPAPPPDLPPFVESRVDLGSDEFEYQLADVDLDSRVDLLVTVAVNGERMMRLWRQRADSSFPAVPDWQLAVPADVTAFALLDVREEAGREVLLMTRAGIHSLTTTREGLQGNVRRELTDALFPDLPDPQHLPCWRLTMDVDGDGNDELLVVSGNTLQILSTAKRSPTGSAGAPALRPLASLSCRLRPASRATGSFSIGGGGMRGQRIGGGTSFFSGARTSQPAGFDARLLDRRRTLELPRLLDFAGDGALEQVIAVDDGWHVSALPILPEVLVNLDPIEIRSAHVALPPVARDAAVTQWVDLDGDGQRELVVFGGATDAGSDDKVALAFKSTPDPKQPELGALIDATPCARVKLGGMSVQYSLTDVDHDGRQDLTARTLDVPTGLSTLATVRLDTAFHVFRGQPGPTWSKAPDFSWERTFRPEQMARVQESLLINLGGDFDGDGVNDLVTTQLDGRVEIRHVSRGAVLELEKRPIVSFAPPSAVERLETWDLSMDGVADLMLRHEKALTFFVSRKSSGSGDGK